MDHYAKSDDEIYKEIQQTALEDSRLSTLLRRMKTLNSQAKVPLPIQFLRFLHLSKMPADMQMIVDALTADHDEVNYCNTADRMYQRWNSLQTPVDGLSSIIVNSVPNETVSNSDPPSATDTI